MPSHTHTFVTLAVSQSTYDEISRKLKGAGYDHCFLPPDNGIDTDPPTIDMHGLALTCNNRVKDSEGRMTTMLYQVKFTNGTMVDIDVSEFGDDEIGYALDKLARKHDGVAAIYPSMQNPAIIQWPNGEGMQPAVCTKCNRSLENDLKEVQTLVATLYADGEVRSSGRARCSKCGAEARWNHL